MNLEKKLKEAQEEQEACQKQITTLDQQRQEAIKQVLALEGSIQAYQELINENKSKK